MLLAREMRRTRMLLCRMKHAGTLSVRMRRRWPRFMRACCRARKWMLRRNMSRSVRVVSRFCCCWKRRTKFRCRLKRENVLKKREAVFSTGALYVDYAARQTPSLTSGQPKPALKAPQDISRGRGFKALRWAAPVGAIAAGLLIWIVVRDNKVQTPSHFENVQSSARAAKG